MVKIKFKRAYFLIIKNTLQTYFIYRANFLLWRFRSIFRILLLYFFWQAIFTGDKQLFGYNRAEIITYVLVVSVLRDLVFSTRTVDLGEKINSGELTNILLLPINCFRYFLSQDIADKLINLFFSLLEISLFIFIFRPPLLLPSNIFTFLLFLTASFLALWIYFLISFLLGLLGFWTNEVWAPRFISTMIIEFFSGGMFPLDILPLSLLKLSFLLPFSYILYFPVQIYLGKASFWLISGGLLMAIFWIIFFSRVVVLVWRKGVKTYSAQGR